MAEITATPSDPADRFSRCIRGQASDGNNGSVVIPRTARTFQTHHRVVIRFGCCAVDRSEPYIV